MSNPKPHVSSGARLASAHGNRLSALSLPSDMTVDGSTPAGSWPWPALPLLLCCGGVSKFPPSLGAPFGDLWVVLPCCALQELPAGLSSPRGPARCPRRWDSLPVPPSTLPGITRPGGSAPGLVLPSNPGSCRAGGHRAGLVGAVGGTSAAPSAYRSAARCCGPMSSS